MHEDLIDQLKIRQLVENWAIWRDAGDWERFRTVWHEDGVMMATWFQGPFEDFIRVTMDGWNKGVSILHFLGGCSVDLVGNRAIAQTKMTISQRGLVDGVFCDVLCTGRFYDFFEKREGRWGLVQRQPIYEKDRVDPVGPEVRYLYRRGADWLAHARRLAVKREVERWTRLIHEGNIKAEPGDLKDD